jgi:hypothetical protein
VKTVPALLRELEPLTHAARMKRLMKLGQAAATDSGAAAVIAALENGDFYQRFLALHSCFGSRGSAVHFSYPCRQSRGGGGDGSGRV